MLPYIAVITPTKNRRQHLEFQVEQMKEQTYPIDRITWIITDSSDSIDTSWKEIETMYPNIIYMKLSSSTTLGLSRNMGLNIATSLRNKPEYILFMDDDDIVHKDRFRESVEAMENNQSYSVGGCSNIFIFLVKGEDLVEVGSLREKSNYTLHHALEPTLIVKYDYILHHFFDDKDPRGLLPPFLNYWSVPILELEPSKVCLLIGHDTNTFDKYQIAKDENKLKFNVVNHYKGYGIKKVADNWDMKEELVDMFRVIHYEYL
jgi:glycosyltransferase involved in cell wall biosynthesis